MTSMAICFGLLILSCFVWLSRDNTHWKDMKENLVKYYAKANEHLKVSNDAQSSVLALKILFNSYKKDHENTQDHLHKLQQTVLLLEHKIKTLSDQVHGSIIKLPESISITLTKEVKSAATSRNISKKSHSPIKDSKIRRAKVATKASRRAKRNAGL